MASSSATSRLADIVSVEEFIEGQENENTRKKTEQNITLLEEFLTLKGKSRAVEEILPDELNSFTSERKKERRQRRLWAQFIAWFVGDLSTGTGNTNKTSSSQHAENSATAVLSDGQQSTQAMSLFTSAVIDVGQFSISINSLNQSSKLAVQEAKAESSQKRCKRLNVLNSIWLWLVELYLSLH